jgi:hypothetical protein
MKINYSVTSQQRKALVNAISQELNASAKYLGAPTFAYEVAGYLIDKNGILEGQDNLELVEDLQGLHDFKAVTEEYDTPLPQAESVPDNLQIPYEAALGGRVSPYSDFEEPPAYGKPEDEDTIEYNRLTIEIPRSLIADTALENLKDLVKSKESLIKKALGMDSIPIIENEEFVTFPWFKGECSSDEVRAFTSFITLLCDMAKKLTRVNKAEKVAVNEKYAFRCFLLRLGFIGSEYKAERKILLSRLTGSSAFKSAIKNEVTDSE